MSVLLRGIEMPKKGEYRMTLYVCDDGYAYMDVDLFPVDKDRFEAIPVPPHGRLIDADKIPYKKIMLDDDDEFYYGVTQPYIDRMPAVIEAEEG